MLDKLKNIIAKREITENNYNYIIKNLYGLKLNELIELKNYILHNNYIFYEILNIFELNMDNPEISVSVNTIIDNKHDTLTKLLYIENKVNMVILDIINNDSYYVLK